MLTREEFEKAMLPVVEEMRSRGQGLEAFAREARVSPRPFSAEEYFLLLAFECGRTFSRREKNYE